jgi:hypothetical protein
MKLAASSPPWKRLRTPSNLPSAGCWPACLHPRTILGDMEKRRAERTPLGVFANRYIDGQPYAVEVLDASSNGLRVRTMLEPDTEGRETFPIEVRVDDVRIWAWTRRVWKRGDCEALRIVSADPLERARFKKLLRERSAA